MKRRRCDTKFRRCFDTSRKQAAKERLSHIVLCLINYVPRVLCTIILEFAHEFSGRCAFSTHGDQVDAMDHMILIKTLRGKITITNIKTNEIIWSQTFEDLFLEIFNKNNIDLIRDSRFSHLYLIRPHHILLQTDGKVFRVDTNTNQVSLIFDNIIWASKGSEECVWILNRDRSNILFNNVTGETALFAESEQPAFTQIVNGTGRRFVLVDPPCDFTLRGRTANFVWKCEARAGVHALMFCAFGKRFNTLIFHVPTELFETTRGVFALQDNGMLFSIHTTDDSCNTSLLCVIQPKSMFQGEMNDGTLVFSRNDTFLFTTNENFVENGTLEENIYDCHVGSTFVIARKFGNVRCFT